MNPCKIEDLKKDTGNIERIGKETPLAVVTLLYIWSAKLLFNRMFYSGKRTSEKHNKQVLRCNRSVGSCGDTHGRTILKSLEILTNNIFTNNKTRTI